LKNIIIGPAFPLRGGIANFNEALCRAFLKKGDSSKIFSFSLQYPKFLFPGKTQFEERNKKPDDIIVETLINSINPFSWVKVVKKAKRGNPDYVIIRYWLPFMAPCLGTIARWIKKNSTIKIIAITDNVIPHEKRTGDRALTNYFVKACDGFIVMSKSVASDLSQFTKNKNIVYLPHPVYNIFGEKINKEDAQKKLNLNVSDKYILFFGFIRKYKGLDLLLEAMNDARIKQLNVKLIVAGEYYEDKKYYEKIIARFQLEKNILLHTNYIPSEEVKNYFCAADMIVQPYRSATQSGVTQIAYHFERPMLVTNVGGLAETIPDKKVGYVCDINPKSIADGIIDFYENRREKEFTSNIAIEKKKFEWDSFVEGIEKLYTQIKTI